MTHRLEAPQAGPGAKKAEYARFFWPMLPGIALSGASRASSHILRTYRYPDLSFEVRALGENTRPANPNRIQNAARGADQHLSAFGRLLSRPGFVARRS